MNRGPPYLHEADVLRLVVDQLCRALEFVRLLPLLFELLGLLGVLVAVRAVGIVQQLHGLTQVLLQQRLHSPVLDFDTLLELTHRVLEREGGGDKQRERERERERLEDRGLQETDSV